MQPLNSDFATVLRLGYNWLRPPGSPPQSHQELLGGPPGLTDSSPHQSAVPCGAVEALRRGGAAPAGDQVLRGHRGQQQHQLQRCGGGQPGHELWVDRDDQPGGGQSISANERKIKKVTTAKKCAVVPQQAASQVTDCFVYLFVMCVESFLFFFFFVCASFNCAYRVFRTLCNFAGHRVVLE